MHRIVADFSILLGSAKCELAWVLATTVYGKDLVTIFLCKINTHIFFPLIL